MFAQELFRDMKLVPCYGTVFVLRFYHAFFFVVELFICYRTFAVCGTIFLSCICVSIRWGTWFQHLTGFDPTH